MDDIYDDLENYDQVNLIEELRDENSTLKKQLEEYTTRLSVLQKDFDTLACEFKKLEMNYSSLLITSRKEVERKTQIINTLNMEKDMKVLSFLKGERGGRNVLNTNKKFNNKIEVTKRNGKDSDTDSTEKHKNYHTSNESHKEINNRNKRLPDNRTPSADTASTVNINHKYSSSNDDKYLKNDLRENVAQDHKSHKNDNKQSGKTSSAKIKTRRKSMPVGSFNAKFSSDEECEDNDLRYRKKSPIRHEYPPYTSYDRYSSRPDSSRGWHNNKHRGSWYHDDDRHRKRDRSRNRYEKSHQSRHRYSPERVQQWGYLQYPDEVHPNTNYERQRVLVSPPTDSYRQSRDLHRSRSKRSTYDRDRSREHETRHHEQVPLLPQNLNDSEEPCKKRMRTESYRHLDNERPYNDVLTPNERMMYEDLEIAHTSCQSPDHFHIDNSVPIHKVKEIRYTAITNLPDPRLTSNKYTLIKDTGDKDVLSTTTGRKVDIKCVDRSLWKLPFGFTMPDALKVTPPQMRRNFVYNVYADIEKSVDTSIESGEIITNESNVPKTFFYKLKDKKTQKSETHQLENCDGNTSDSVHIDSQEIEEHRFSESLVINENTKAEAVSVNTGKTKHLLHEGSWGAKNKLTDLPDLGKPIENEEKDSSQSQVKNNITEAKDNQYNELPFVTDIKHSVEKHNILSDSIRTTIEVDLELSDVSSNDNYDLQCHTKKRVAGKKKDKDSVFKKRNNEDDKTPLTIHQNEQSKVKETPLLDLKNKESKELTSDRSKKPRLKKINNTEENPKESIYSKNELKKKRKGKKDKESKQGQTKTKFTDLFGDSSSLITPDDLGIPLCETNPQPCNTYVSIFDDTQDAVDLNIEKIKKTKAQSSKTKCDVDVDSTETKGKEKPKNITTKKLDNRKSKSKDEIQIPCGTTSEKDNGIVNLKIPNVTDVVKTVVISSGVQGNSVTEIGKLETNNLDVEGKHETDKVTTSNSNAMVPGIKALATSTPYKIPTPDVSCNSEVSNKTLDCNTLDSQLNSTNSNTPVVQNDADVPDVRIFVRRRRKVLKK